VGVDGDPWETSWGDLYNTAPDGAYAAARLNIIGGYEIPQGSENQPFVRRSKAVAACRPSKMCLRR
jgi:hypothetical protein